jgi:hypothetical protein
MEPSPGILAIWHDIAPEHFSDVLAWYDREHHFERLAVPGFRNVRRYHAVEGKPAIFIRYETRDVGVLSSSDYLARLNNPTAWTLRCQPRLINNSRTVCFRKGSLGRAEGGVVAVVRLEAAEAPFPEIQAMSQAMEEVLAQEGVVGLELWKADHARSVLPTREKQLRGVGDSYVSAVLVAHATGRIQAEDALQGMRGLVGSTKAGLQLGLYQLAFAAHSTI